MAKVGRSSKKHLIKEALDNGLIQKWGEIGLTDKQIAEQLHIGVRILYEFKKEFPQFVQTLTRARMSTPVQNAWNGLARLSTGFHEKTVRKHVKIRKDANGNIVSREEEVIEEDYYVPPQTQACAKILANYYHQAQKALEGMPEEYITEPLPSQRQDRTGRLPEMDEAMRQLFFGGAADNNEHQ